MEIKNLKKAAQRIKKAIRQKERIILYGDADLDGVTSLIILKEAIKNLAGKISAIYFPDRETEGYGITEKGLSELKKFAPALLITLDLGISSFKEVKLAKKNGFEIIIIDHHEILDKLPEAKIIVDPKQKGDKYPFKGLATVGIVFKLSEVLLRDKLTENLRKNFLELVALATLADLMPREKENLEFIEQGLKSLENSWRPGIQALLKNESLNQLLDFNQKVSRIISLLNVRDSSPQGLAKWPVSFRLLDSPSLEESKELVERLILKNKFRKKRIDEIVAEIGKRLQPSHFPLANPPTLKRKKEEPIIFEGNSDWELTLISSVASIICRQYQKPTFIFKISDKESQGTVRTPPGIDSVALMKKCQKYLITYGGHPQASGFRIKNENLENFKKCLIKNLCR